LNTPINLLIPGEGNVELDTQIVNYNEVCSKMLTALSTAAAPTVPSHYPTGCQHQQAPTHLLSLLLKPVVSCPHPDVLRNYFH